jgi:hypothetical protein
VTTILIVLKIVVVAYLPGAIAMRLPGGSKAYRAGLRVEERAFWAVVLSLAWSLGLTVALGLLGRYSFDRLIVTDAIAIFLGVIVFRHHLRFEPGTASRLSSSALLPLALIALGGWLYFPSAEYIIGGRDPGVYINEGIQIAQRGQIVIKDPMVTAVPPAFRELFFPDNHSPNYYSHRFMGFFIEDPDRGVVVGQLPHLFPASVAIAYGITGLTGAINAVGWWTTLGLLSVYFAASRLIGRRAALLAAVLLAINVMSIWFGRYPNSEVVMQTLLFAALLAFDHARIGARVFFGVVAGALLGLMLFLRYEIVLAYISVGVAAMILPAVRQKVGVAFGLALLPLGIAGYLYLKGPLWPYAFYPLTFTQDHFLTLFAAIVVATVLVRGLLHVERVRLFVARATPVAVAVTLAALAIYAYFFRTMTGRLAYGDMIAFRTFAWYVGPWVLAVAVAGATVLFARRFWDAPALFLTLAAFSVFFFYKTRVIPEHFWAARRFVGVTLPGVAICLAATVDWLVTNRIAAGVIDRLAGRPESGWRLGLREGLAFLFAAVIAAPIAVTFWRISEPILHHVEYEGLVPKLEALSKQIGPRDLLLVEARNAGSDLHVLAPPLAYIYAHDVLVLMSPVPEREAMGGFLEWARSRYDNILFLGGGGTDLLTSKVGAIPVSADRFQVPEYETVLNAMPTHARRKDLGYGLYRLVPIASAPDGPADIQIGALDDLNVLRFYARERSSEGVAFRWSAGQSFIVLPARPANPKEIVVWMGTGGRPADAPPAVVQFALDDVDIGSATVTGEVKPYSIVLPPAMAGQPRTTPARVRLRVPTWSPAALLGGDDTRDLGVQVTRVEAR